MVACLKKTLTKTIFNGLKQQHICFYVAYQHIKDMIFMLKYQ